MVLAASLLASVAPADADPAYSSDNVIQIFLKQKDALKGDGARALCVGTAADCKKQEGAARPLRSVDLSRISSSTPTG